MLRCIRPDFVLIDLTVNGSLAFRKRQTVHSSVLLSQIVIFFDLRLFNYLPSTSILTVIFLGMSINAAKEMSLVTLLQIFA